MQSEKSNAQLLSQVERVVEDLLTLMADLPAGGKLPSERDLAKELGVARMTLRRAMEMLIFRGLLERRAGSGTFVTKQLLASELRLASFSEEIRSRGLTPSTKVISLKKVKASRSTALELRIPEQEEVYIFTRLRLADDNPVALESTKLPARYAPGLTAELLGQSLYELLYERYGVRIVSAKTQIAATSVEAENAKLLDVPLKQPCLELHMQDFDQRGRLIMTAHCLYRADMYKLSISAKSGVLDKSEIRTSSREAI
jgi:GntR family transcriptional regulator